MCLFVGGCTTISLHHRFLIHLNPWNIIGIFSWLAETIRASFIVCGSLSTRFPIIFFQVLFRSANRSSNPYCRPIFFSLTIFTCHIFKPRIHIIRHRHSPWTWMIYFSNPPFFPLPWYFEQFL